MAAYDILALDTATPQVRVPGTSDTYSLPRATSLAAGTLTSDVKVFDVSATMNSGATAFTLLRYSFTDTASAAATRVFDYLMGGASRLALTKGGKLIAADASGSSSFERGYFFSNGGGEDLGFVRRANNVIDFALQGSGYYSFNSSTGFQAHSTGQIQWTSGLVHNTSADTGFARAAAGVVRTTNGGSGSGAMQFGEMTAPAALADTARVYAQDNGSGKTQLMVRFGTGAAVQIAIEP